MKLKIENPEIGIIKADTNVKKNLNNSEKVDINILLNRIRLDSKKKKIKNIIYLSLISFTVLLAGIFYSV